MSIGARRTIRNMIYYYGQKMFQKWQKYQLLNPSDWSIVKWFCPQCHLSSHAKENPISSFLTSQQLSFKHFYKETGEDWLEIENCMLCSWRLLLYFIGSWSIFKLVLVLMMMGLSPKRHLFMHTFNQINNNLLPT